MTDPRPNTHSRWCIVVADAAAPDWTVSENSDAQSAPVQYCGLGEPTTMLQKALHRARRIAHATRILVTATEVHRAHWQSALWFMPPEHRFVSESPGWSSLTTAAAVLSIAARAPSACVTILPARCYVADEWTLTVALHTALSKPAFVADGVVTLGMAGGASEVDEDYLMVGDESDGRPIVPVSVTARRPIDWVAHHLVGRGALVASGIYVGHADALAALLYKYWPKVTHQLLRHVARSFAPGVENRLPPTLVEEALQAAPQSFWKHLPWMPVRALRVAHCGWSSLRSRRAIEQIIAPQPSAPSIKASLSASPRRSILRSTAQVRRT
jgi:mannose-1-phosphate guanylyltransferase